VQPLPASLSTSPSVLAIFSVSMNKNYKNVTVFERKRKGQQEL
jgi:hypothetical protein